MSEAERRRNYRYDRVLIETTRILSPQFNPAVVYLTGAQIELLRNMTQYLRRLETYVTTYAEGYYLTPTVADYDDLLAIVADLEETLMGNDNTIWGYEDTIFASVGRVLTADATYNRILFTCPAGYIYIIHGVSSINMTTALETRHRINDGAAAHEIAVVDPQPADKWMITGPVRYVLKEGDYLMVSMFGALTGDETYVRAFGIKMKVPE